MMAATCERQTPLSLTEALARKILAAVDEGSAQMLLEALTEAVQVDPSCVRGGAREQEQLDLLRGIAIQLRVDLHAVLMHLYQHLEASRTYLAMLRHLAGESETAREGQAIVLPWPRHSIGTAAADDKNLEQRTQRQGESS